MTDISNRQEPKTPIESNDFQTPSDELIKTEVLFRFFDSLANNKLIEIRIQQ